MQITLATKPSEIVAYLLEVGVLVEAPANASVEKPGEGNMNIVLRLKYDGQSLIIKQSKDFVQKYPSIPAPKERIKTEAKFYQYAAEIPALIDQMPYLAYFDADNHIIVMQDLGKGTDYTYLYQREEKLTKVETQNLLEYLSHLHGKAWSASAIKGFPKNLKLRQLNHEHIFVLPFQADNGFDLEEVQAGLSEIASIYHSDKKLKTVVEALGEKYLSAGNQLLHGDYYPGSWMNTRSGLCIIDPEFAFMGHATFELGVYIAHLLMSGYELSAINEQLAAYYTLDYDQKEAQQYAGVEIMRRLIGIAQLPLNMSVIEKAELLAQAHKMILP